ncbi:hypothetical protein C8F01DRAFT_1109594 [Mycena amicta]|nr:hypothetical protein C8F01DRAFT_1109594 [Mycena amicta]
MSSDTESESEHASTAPFVPPVALGAPPDSILDSIAQIRDLENVYEPETVIQDTRIHEIIALAANELLKFLDSFQDLVVRPTETTRQRLVDFAALVDIQFLTTLFQQRTVFHQIAAQTMDQASGAVVCWVDAILAKIGDAAVSIASGIPLEHLNPAFSFPGSRAEDGLRAASQLPADWWSVSSVISSEEASPAARRLALRLSFAAFVLGPALSAEKQHRMPRELIDVLERYLDQTSTTGFSASIAGDRLALQERLNFAMVVCLFATADRQHGNRMHTRPHSLGRLLRLLQEVIHPEETPASLQLVNPPGEVDHAVDLLLSWGDTVSWCWEVWDDHRMANAESIVYLSSLWLQIPQDQQTVSITTASSIAVLKVLHHIVLALSSAIVGSAPASPTVISNACFYGVKSLEYLLSCLAEEQCWIISGFCKVFLSLFVLLEPKPTQTIVSDLVLEALSLVDSETLALCLVHVQQDASLRFSMRLNERLVLVRNFVSVNPQIAWHCDGLTLVRATLNLLIIIWLSKTPGSVPKQPASALLSAVTEFLSHNNSSRTALEILGDAILTASATDPTIVDQQRETLWKLALTRLPSDVCMAASFAHYIGAATTLCASLYCAEGWRYLGETLLLILKRHYLDEQEPLALLVCPMICRGLLRLLGTDPAGRQYMVSTPLTLNMCTEMKQLFDTSEHDEYTNLLKERLATVGPCLLEAIRCKSAPTSVDMHARLIFYGGRVAVVVE